MVSPSVYSKDETTANKITSRFSSRQISPPLRQLLRFSTSRHYIISEPPASNPNLATEKLQSLRGIPRLTACILILNPYHLIYVHVELLSSFHPRCTLHHSIMKGLYVFTHTHTFLKKESLTMTLKTPTCFPLLI